MTLEIVSHCWRYSRLLSYQLSSLSLFPAKTVDVTATIFLCDEDSVTDRVVRFYEEANEQESLRIRAWRLPRVQLMRRAIGRNMAAVSSEADWIWFADCDYLFRDGALDSLAKELQDRDGPLFYPQRILASRTHAHGDRAIAAADVSLRMLDVNPDDFAPQRLDRAIGGAQIASGPEVRRLGYCNGTKWVQNTAMNWQGCREDRAFRKQMGSRGVPLNICNVFRIRHSRRGRDHDGLDL